MGKTIPYFTATFSYGSRIYSYSMVGTNPKRRGETTAVPVTIVPVKLSFSSGVALDATSLASDVVKSPLFTAAQFMGETTQFGDAVMRSEILEVRE